MLAKKGLSAAPAAVPQYVEDVFSTYLWTGNATARDIVNGIDLAGEGGLVWTKRRNDTNVHQLTDTARGVSYQLNSASTAAQSNEFNRLTAFNADGFSISTGTDVNANTGTYASWTFRKAKKFFDVVTYTGTGTARTVSHNLGSVPGVIIVKSTSIADGWATYHRSLGATKYVWLHNTNAANTLTSFWNDTEPTSTQFTVATNDAVNQNGATYVAYLFAHDAGGFGDAGDQSIIKCGSFTTDGSGNATVDLGWEPQWILAKGTSTARDWWIFDNMREMSFSNTLALRPNLSNAEYSFGSGIIQPTATGFNAVSFDSSGVTWAYIAIRRGPMKTPTTGTSVYAGVTANAASTPVLVTFNTVIESGDLGFATNLNNANRAYGGTTVFDRLRGANYLFTNATDAEGAASGQGFIDQKSYVRAFGSGDVVGHFFRRAPGFFDVVCYTGTGTARTVSHNLGVAPELIIYKNRSSSETSWIVQSDYLSSNINNYFFLNATNAELSFSDLFVAPTSTTIGFGTGLPTYVGTNASGSNYVAYLFASLSGVSKVGSYTGNGSSVTVTTGFQPRFILVKRTDSTGNWIVSDSARGLVAGNDPYLLLNSTAAEDTDEDWVDISSTGFTVNQTTASNANVNTGTYIYLCIA